MCASAEAATAACSGARVGRVPVVWCWVAGAGGGQISRQGQGQRQGLAQVLRARVGDRTCFSNFKRKLLGRF